MDAVVSSCGLIVRDKPAPSRFPNANLLLFLAIHIDVLSPRPYITASITIPPTDVLNDRMPWMVSICTSLKTMLDLANMGRARTVGRTATF